MTLAIMISAALTAATLQHGAHVHGSAELAIGLDDEGRIQVELYSAAHNIYGFEHDAHTEEEHAHAHHAMEDLSDGNELFDFGAANCSLTDVQIEDEENDHGHRDVHAVYSGTCSNPDRLSVVRTHMFEHFSELEDIDGVFVSDSAQLSFELTRSSPEARLAQ